MKHTLQHFQQHFTISQLEVEAECVCNGQNDACNLDDSGQFSCVCGGNTDGEHCEICLPKFNQEPYQYGTACTGTCGVDLS